MSWPRFNSDPRGARFGRRSLEPSASRAFGAHGLAYRSCTIVSHRTSSCFDRHRDGLAGNASWPRSPTSCAPSVRDPCCCLHGSRETSAPGCSNEGCRMSGIRRALQGWGRGSIPTQILCANRRRRFARNFPYPSRVYPPQSQQSPVSPLCTLIQNRSANTFRGFR
jgi:hypothetical protein